MQAIILAGGVGTRLKSVVGNVAKPMAPINETPFLEYILKNLKKNKITNVVLSVGYKWKTIESHFGSNFNGLDLRYSIEEEPLGTGGAIKKSIELISDDLFFIINGDTFFDLDLDQMMRNFQNNSQLMLSLKLMYEFDRYGCVEVDNRGYVTAFKGKRFRKSGYINGGIYLAKKSLFQNFNLPNKFSFEGFMEKNFLALNAHAKIFNGYFIDIGVPDDFQKAQTELRGRI